MSQILEDINDNVLSLMIIFDEFLQNLLQLMMNYVLALIQRVLLSLHHPIDHRFKHILLTWSIFRAFSRCKHVLLYVDLTSRRVIWIEDHPCPPHLVELTLVVFIFFFLVHFIFLTLGD